MSDRSTPASVRERLEFLIEHRLYPSWALMDRRGLLEPSLQSMVSALATRETLKNDWRTKWEDRVFGWLESEGVEALVLKGAALARWLYDDPGQRGRVDLDLLVRAADEVQVEGLLADHGYEQRADSLSRTQVCWQGQGKHRRELVDLHWVLSDQPVFHHAFSFDILWESSFPVAEGFSRVRRLDPVWSLIHAIVHYWGSDPKHELPRIMLLDMTLLWEGLDDSERDRFEALCLEHGLSGLTARSFELCVAEFKLDIDADRVRRMRADGQQQWQTALSEPDRSAWRNLLLGLRGQPTLTAKTSLLRQVIFPPASYMRQKYPQGSVVGLPGLYLRRIFGRD
jgi:hypothetical protein